MSDGELVYVGLLVFSGLLLIVLAARGVRQSALVRAAEVLFGLGFLGYAGYLAIGKPAGRFEPAMVFVVPVVAIGLACWARRRTRTSHLGPATFPQPYEKQLQITPLTPFPPLPPPLGAQPDLATPAAPHLPAYAPPAPPPIHLPPIETATATATATARNSAPVGTKRPPMPSALSAAPRVAPPESPRPSGLVQVPPPGVAAGPTPPTGGGHRAGLSELHATSDRSPQPEATTAPSAPPWLSPSLNPGAHHDAPERQPGGNQEDNRQSPTTARWPTGPYENDTRESGPYGVAVPSPDLGAGQLTPADNHVDQPGSRLRQPGYLDDQQPGRWPQRPPDRGRHRAAE